MQNSNIFRVFVNGVDVGSLPEHDYRNIISEVTTDVKNDRRLILAQAFNLIECLWRLMIFVVRIQPLIFLIPIAFALIFTPDMVTEIITEIRSATPAEITGTFRFLLIFIFILEIGIGIPLASILMGYRFGYINKFKLAIGEKTNLRIRSILEVPATGVVEVHVRKGFNE